MTQKIEFFRFRRLRKTENLRRMVRENFVRKSDLIYPLFVVPGTNIKTEVPSMPGVYQMSIDNIVKECKYLEEIGIPAIILFGIPEYKDEFGSDAMDENGIVQRCVREIKKEVKNLVVITDVCFCEYTSHGHCGIVRDGDVDNDATIENLGKEALSHVKAGADMVAPSDMMDGRVKMIRTVLDENGFTHIPIMAYSAKYSSSFYGPFRDAAESAPQFGDRRTYQMDPPNLREAIREVEEDIKEGADIVMVKPALSYLDVIRSVRENFNYPIAAYNVSGEYSMVKAAAKLGWIDGDRVATEILISIKRAGADLILTYFAKELVEKGIITE